MPIRASYCAESCHARPLSQCMTHRWGLGPSSQCLCCIPVLLIMIGMMTPLPCAGRLLWSFCMLHLGLPTASTGLAPQPGSLLTPAGVPPLTPYLLNSTQKRHNTSTATLTLTLTPCERGHCRPHQPAVQPAAAVQPSSVWFSSV